MIVTPVPHGLEDLIGKSGPRTPGLHASTLYNSLYEDIEPERYRKGGTPDPLRLEAGLAFEQTLEDAIRERLSGGERPGELTYNDPKIGQPILFNPDLIMYGAKLRVGEIKLTWASCRNWPIEQCNDFPVKANKYITQMKLYCHMLDCNLSRLIAFFVNGAYENFKSGNPLLRAWDFEFTKREIREEWETCIAHARHKRLI